MRALTQCSLLFQRLLVSPGNNEVLAREGIDTCPLQATDNFHSVLGNNEVLAREGIDTVFCICLAIETYIFVTMRY